MSGDGASVLKASRHSGQGRRADFGSKLGKEKSVFQDL